MTPATRKYLIHSASEDGFWSNEHGWSCLRDATMFEETEMHAYSLPMSSGGDARWVDTREANLALTMYCDWDSHGVDCLCGECNPQTGDSFGCAIKTVADPSEVGLDEAIGSDNNVVGTIFAPSPAAARDSARTRLESLGYLFAGDY